MPVDVVTANSPLIIALPYTGTNIQPLVSARLRDPDHAFTVPDYHIDRVFSGLNDAAGMVRCNVHRYVCDVNAECAADGMTASPGRIGPVPLVDAAGNSIWAHPPQKTEAANWRSSCYVPFHAALSAQIAKTRSAYGHAVVLTCRGLKTRGPCQQANIEADINLASHLGGSCSVDLSAKLMTIARATDKYSARLNGSRGAGWITRHYGRPSGKVHALDISIRDTCYLTQDDFPGQYDAANAETLRDILRDMVNFAVRWHPK